METITKEEVVFKNVTARNFTCDECGKDLGKILNINYQNKFSIMDDINHENSITLDFKISIAGSRFDGEHANAKYHKHFCAECKKKKIDQFKKIIEDFGFEYSYGESV